MQQRVDLLLGHRAAARQLGRVDDLDVHGQRGQQLTLLAHGQIRRPDLSRERDLGAEVRRPLCEAIGWPCEPEQVKLLSSEG